MDAEFSAMLSPSDCFDYNFAQLRVTHAVIQMYYFTREFGVSPKFYFVLQVYNMPNKPKSACSSFKERIKKFENELNNNLGILLQLISLSGVTECGSQLLHFLTR